MIYHLYYFINNSYLICKTIKVEIVIQKVYHGNNVSKSIPVWGKKIEKNDVF